MGPFLLFLIAIVLQVSKVDSNDKHVKLHNMMTLDEMKEYLETDTEHDIPEYQAIKLSPSNSREKRSASRSGKLYSLTAFDTDMHLDLTTPSNTIGNHGVLVQRRTAKGAHDEIYYPDGEMYHGHVTGDSNSRVAVQVSKDGKKLSGSIFTNDHVYKIQPMNKRLRDKANLHGDEHHVISRREFRKSFFDNVETSKVLESAELRSKRSGHVTLTGPRIIELMITIDKPTYDFYGNQTLDYVLNVANMVNRLYRDPSMGFDLSVVLTKVFIIQHNEPAMDIQSKQIGSARVYIDKFREWVLGMSDLSPPAAPGHFDHASLLTRRICGINFCELDGLAFSGYPCNKKLDFNINKASGLQAAFSIAHEMAHNIGLGHDEGDCRKGFIMNGGQGSGPNSFRWSPCSSMKMKEIMSRETCYSDKPATSYPVPRRYPGYIYDADTQCKMAFDSTYSICSDTKNSCNRLFCYKGSGCVGYVGAPVDGTPCGQRKWCIRGSCVDVGNDLPPAIDGQWGSWSNDYTSCTRPCGRGVRFRKRYCNNPSPQYFGKSCQGPSTGHPEICNPQDCPTPTDFRLEQCKKRGHDTFYYNGKAICRLRCRDGRVVTVLNGMVDGTPCYLNKNKKDVCIQGQCKKVGCDSETGTELDRCNCDENGNCEQVKLPTNIWIIGEWTECSKTCSGGQQTRSVTCQQIQMTSQLATVTVNDTYCDQTTKPENVQACNQQGCPEWITSLWSECSVKCGEGSRTRTVSCEMSTSLNKRISLGEASCITAVGPKPPTSKHCIATDCYEWATENSCDACRGYHHLGCFGDTEDRTLPQLLKSDLSATDPLGECHNATAALGYNVFGVQNGECWSSATGEQTYNKHGSSTLCKNGIGGEWSNDVYKIAPKMSYYAIGCFKDNHRANKRPLPSLVGNHRGSIVWTNMNKTVAKCSVDAWNAGFPVFGVQFYGECWSGRLGYETYSADGVSDNCWEGVGGRYANYVYGFDRKVVKTSITCRHIITNAAVSQDHCKQTKPDSGLRLCEHAC